MSNLDKALADFKAGKFVIVTDDADRENEGDLFILGAAVTAEDMGFMVRYTSGVICAAITEDIANRLALPYMVKRNQDSKRYLRDLMNVFAVKPVCQFTLQSNHLTVL